MKKRIIQVLCLLMATMLLVIPNADKKMIKVTNTEKCKEIVSSVNRIDVKILRKNTETKEIIETKSFSEIMLDAYVNDINDISTISDKKEWYLEYKRINTKYEKYVDVPETIYDYYTFEELEKLLRVVEAECTEGDFINKCHVASVIFNRIEHEDFGYTLKEVLRKDQFSPLADGRYLKVNVTEDTILACEYVFAIEDTTGGALYFDSCKKSWAARNKKKLFTDGIGHTFYK